MTEDGIFSFAGLALAQIIFYKIRLKQAARICWALWGIYFAMFLLLQTSRTLEIPAPLASGIPLLLFALLFMVCEFLKRFQNIKLALQREKNFYLYSGIWAAVIQVSFSRGGAIVNGLLESLLAASLLPLLAAVNERLELLDIPKKLAGLPALLITGGILAMGLKFVF